MAGDWIKIEHTTPDKPEVVTMAYKLSIDQDSVVGKLVRIWLWADQNSLNGNALTVTDAFLDRVTACPGFAGALREVGWLSGRQGLLTIPNFDRHNGQTAKARAVTNRRVARHRDKSDGNAGTVTSVTPAPLQKPLPEKRREEKSNTQYIAPGAGAVAETGANQAPPPPVEPAKRARNLLLDALAGCGGVDPLQVVSSAWGGIGKCLAEIRAVCPDLTVDEIKRRSVNYRTHMSSAPLTPQALAKHWAMCDKPATRNGQPAPVLEPRFADAF